MKNVTITAILVIVTGIAMFALGRQSRQKDFEAACKMSDVIRCYQDNGDCFDDICNDFLDDVELGDYVWAY